MRDSEPIAPARCLRDHGDQRNFVEEKTGAKDEVATQPGLIREMKNEKWRTAVMPGGPGISLDLLKEMLAQSLKVSGVQGFEISIVHADSNGPELKSTLHEDLIENESSDQNFIIANFSQGAFTGDVQVGHIAPVAAYDEKRGRVLVWIPIANGMSLIG